MIRYRLNRAASTLAVLASLLTGHAAAQQPVARLIAVAPASQQFTLEVTLPVPRGTVLPSNGSSPLAIRTSSGEVLATQVEIVSRYPLDSDGADVVELIAAVTRPEGASAGDDIVFDVIESDHTPPPFQRSANVDQLLNSPRALMLTSRDLFGNLYVADVLAKIRSNDPDVQEVRSGAFIQEFRSHEVMIPTANAHTDPAREPYPHLLAAHVFARTYADEDFLVLDMLFHNGMTGFESTPVDDPVHDLYFNQLDLQLPTGWTMGWAFDNPAMGRINPSGDGTSNALIDGLDTGQHHVVPQQSQFPRRLVIAKGEAALARGLEVIRRETRGFCDAGPMPAQVVSDPNSDLWSWWSKSTSRYLTSNTRLPHLNHVPRSTTIATIKADFDEYEEQTRTGAAGGYPTFFPLLGWAQPWGVQYGGMTGGDEIEMLPEVDSAWARHPVAIRWLELRSKGYIERHPVANFDAHGKPPLLEDHLVDVGTPDVHVPIFQYLTERGESNYFGLKSTSLRFAEHAYITGKLPWYDKDLKDFQEIDFQHYTRYLNPQLGLVWLANDSLAKLQIELSHSLVRLSLHQYENSQYGHIQGTGLLRRMQDVAVNPGQGANFGRGPAWEIVASTAQYALADDAQRARLRPWFALIADTARDGQSTCTGNPSALPIARNFKGQYQSRQSFEVGFFLNAAHCMRTTVFEDVDAARTQKMKDFVTDGAYSSTAAPYWNESANGQISLVAVRPKSNLEPEFCLNVPENGIPENYFVDHTTAMPSWAYAFEATQDGLFLLRSGQSLNNRNLEIAIESLGLQQLHETAPILSVLQEL